MSPTTTLRRTRREPRRPMCRRSSARKASRRPSRRTAACPTCRSTGTAMREPPAALEDALAEIAEGEGQRVIDMIDKAPPGPDQDKMGRRVPRLRRVHGLHPQLEQHQSPRRRRGAAAALYGLRAADLLHRPVQRCLAGPGARRRRGDPAQERAGQPAAGPVFPAGAARRAAHRRILSGPVAQQPRMHGPTRRLAGVPRVQVHEHL